MTKAVAFRAICDREGQNIEDVGIWYCQTFWVSSTSAIHSRATDRTAHLKFQARHNRYGTQGKTADEMRRITEEQVVKHWMSRADPQGSKNEVDAGLDARKDD